MDIMEMRFRMMAMMGGTPMGTWKEKKVTNSGTTLQNAYDICTWLNNNKPSASIVIAVIEKYYKETPTINNQFTGAISEGNGGFNYSGYGYRYRSGSYTYVYFQINYDAVLSSGEEVTFLYLE